MKLLLEVKCVCFKIPLWTPRPTTLWGNTIRFRCQKNSMRYLGVEKHTQHNTSFLIIMFVIIIGTVLFRPISLKTLPKHLKIPITNWKAKFFVSGHTLSHPEKIWIVVLHITATTHICKFSVVHSRIYPAVFWHTHAKMSGSILPMNWRLNSRPSDPVEPQTKAEARPAIQQRMLRICGSGWSPLEF